MILNFKKLFQHIIHTRYSGCRYHLHTGSVNDGGISDGVRVRFAPSPTGDLHLGGLRTALYNFLFCRSQSGKFILRIEDTDQTRLVPGATERLIDILGWAGIEVDEGPQHCGPFGPYIQSQRLKLYNAAIETLLENGTAYRCFCTERRLELLRRETKARGETPRYDNRCRHLSQSEISEKLDQRVPHVVRFKLDTHTEPWTDLVYGPIVYDVASIEGDPILLKSDGYPTYHFANVVDDHHMNISHVLRGLEWQVSTTKHILLYRALGWNQPQFAHLPLLQNKDGKKLSKRQSDITVEHYRKAGYFPNAVLNLLTSTGSGFNIRDTAGLTLSQLIQHFDLTKMNTNSTRVDFDKLPEYNRLHLKHLITTSTGPKVKAGNEVSGPDQGQGEVTEARNILLRQVRDLLKENNLNKASQTDLWTDSYIIRVLNWASDRISMLSDLLHTQYRFIWTEPLASECANACLAHHNSSTVCSVIQLAINLLEDLNESEFERDNINRVLSDSSRSENKNSNSCEQNLTESIAGDLKYGQRMQLLRMSVTGCKEGPSVAEIFSVLGRETVLQRINNTLQYINSAANPDLIHADNKYRGINYSNNNRIDSKSSRDRTSSDSNVCNKDKVSTKL